MSPDLARYHRQMLLPGFGEAGQRRLLGPLPCCWAAEHWAVSARTCSPGGVGHLLIIDRDIVELSNLQRHCSMKTTRPIPAQGSGCAAQAGERQCRGGKRHRR